MQGITYMHDLRMRVVEVNDIGSGSSHACPSVQLVIARSDTRRTASHDATVTCHGIYGQLKRVTS